MAGLTACGDCGDLTVQFRQVVNGFAQKEIAPRAAEIDKTNRMPEVR